MVIDSEVAEATKTPIYVKKFKMVSYRYKFRSSDIAAVLCLLFYLRNGASICTETEFEVVSARLNDDEGNLGSLRT